jgi:hypothetical protein
MWPTPECCTTFQFKEMELAAGWSVAKSSCKALIISWAGGGYPPVL